MRFMMLYKPGHENDAPPTAEHMAEMGKFIGEMAKAGVLLATDGLQPSAHGKRVRVNEDGNFDITDGPFTEAKELIGGFAIVQARDMDAAVELAQRFLAITGEGESEIRLMHDVAAFP